jgi:dephospho-CoA kinase
MTNVNIALCGALRAGKDAVAAHLVANYGYTRFAFGDELKRYAHELFDLDTGAKQREPYQWFGQTMRERDPNVWVRKMFAAITKAERSLRSHPLTKRWEFSAVVTDCRQPNEYAALRDRGYVIIRVNCPEETRIQRAISAGDVFDSATLLHDTESHVTGFAVDYEIDNNATLDELYAKVDAIIELLDAPLSTGITEVVE